jgi:hypothetical protein
MVSKRNNFDMIKAKYTKMGKGNVRLTQSSLFLTKDIDPTRSTYTFDVLENQTQTLQPDEIRLNLNDEFTITQAGLFLYGSWTLGIDPVLATSRQLLTYAPCEMDADFIKVKDLYAGTLRIAVNNIVYQEKLDTRRFEKVTRTQFNNGTKNFAAATDWQGATMPSNDFSTDGMIEYAPLIVLSGAKKNEITVTLPNAIAPVTNIHFVNNNGQNVYFNVTKIAVKLFGLNGQNASKFQG